MSSQKFPATFFGIQTIYKEDLKRLGEGCWFNDSLINLFLLWNNDQLQKNSNHDDFCFIDPSVAFICRMTDSENVHFTLQDLKLNDKKWIFIPISDHDSSEFGSDFSAGSHWSLVFFDRTWKDLDSGNEMPTFFVLDSVDGYNLKSSREVIAKFAPEVLKNGSYFLDFFLILLNCF